MIIWYILIWYPCQILPGYLSNSWDGAFGHPQVGGVHRWVLQAPLLTTGFWTAWDHGWPWWCHHFCCPKSPGSPSLTIVLWQESFQEAHEGSKWLDDVGCVWYLVLACCPWPVLPFEIHRISPACILDRIAEGKYEAEPGELEKEKARPPRKTFQKIWKILKISKSRWTSYSQIGSAQTCREDWKAQEAWDEVFLLFFRPSLRLSWSRPFHRTFLRPLQCKLKRLIQNWFIDEYDDNMMIHGISWLYAELMSSILTGN